MMNPQIKFQHNWNNKLDCDIFTTIRRHTEVKWRYYRNMEGKVFDVVLTEFDNAFGPITYTTAKLVGVTTWVLKDIPVGMLVWDTGSFTPYAVFQKFGLRERDQVILLTFAKLGVPL